MATAASSPETVYQDALVNYLISMARTVEGTVNKALEALLGRGEPGAARLASEIFLLEPRINEMEMVIDDQAVRLLRRGNLPEEEIRLTVAALKITNDLERMGDLAVNIGERVISRDGQQEPGRADLPQRGVGEPGARKRRHRGQLPRPGV